jgi:hypothetical protein
MLSLKDIFTALQTANWTLVFAHCRNGISILWAYWMALYQFIFKHVTYSASTAFQDDKYARVQVYSLSLIFKLWSLKHYRSKSFQQDMIDNLKNVAIPGTGVPLSIFCYSYWTCLAYVMFINPFICFWGAVNKVRTESFVNVESAVGALVGYFSDHLLHPNDWFSFWRLNCRLVSLHSALTGHDDYLQEDKWSFLTLGKKLGVPVSPYFENYKNLVCKNKNIEGGMGIFFYKNAAHGGDWILQEKLENADWLNRLLPPNAPLSTMRVITTSTWSLTHSASNSNSNSTGSSGSSPRTPGSPAPVSDASKYVRAESGLLRLGRTNAETDHSSVLFDVDIRTGRIREGTSNAHWYQLGLLKAARCPWLPPKGTVRHHADPPFPQVTDTMIPDMENAVRIVVEYVLYLFYVYVLFICLLIYLFLYLFVLNLFLVL